MRMAMMNVGQMLDCFGVNDPQMRFLTQRPLECMVSRDTRIRLITLLLIFPVNLEGNNQQAIRGWPKWGREIGRAVAAIILSSKHAGGAPHGGYIGQN